MERDTDQDGGIGKHSRGTPPVSKPVAILVIASVVAEERIARVIREPQLGVLRRNRAGLLAVACRARPSVAAEGLALDQPSSLDEVAYRAQSRRNRPFYRVGRVSRSGVSREAERGERGARRRVLVPTLWRLRLARVRR
jgi:hypothetical protein